ncbi:MAG: hypothetical protein IPL53_19945 [Ignavibacteria bacterium]|nr:hypothetical protein [Ignavibacteria bacterium]
MKNFDKVFFLSLVISLLTVYTNSYSQLSGNYIIGPGGNYATINSAVNDLVNDGVNGPVIFNIKPGSYYESVNINVVSGTSLTNTVTFKSQSGVADDVIWYSIKSDTNNFALRINGADFLTFRNLTFTGDSIGNQQRKIVELFDNSNNISFLYNVFKTNNTFISSTFLIYSNSAYCNDLKIIGNSFSATGQVGYRVNREGIKLEGYPGLIRTQISNNVFTDLSSAITVYNSESLLIEKNTIKMGNISSMNFGIFLYNCTEYTRVLKNRITSAYACGSTNVGYSLLTYYCLNSLIANNFILFEGGSVAVLSINNINQRFIHNTIASFGGLCPNNLGIYNCDSVTLKNNIYVNFNTDPLSPGVPYTISNTTFTSDNNNFYYHAPYIARYNEVNIPNLEAWTSISGKDQNSKAEEVSFVSPIDLHLEGYSISDYDLKGIPDSEVVDDIDGNRRDPFYPTKGADEPFYPDNISVSLSIYIEGFYDPFSNTQIQDTVTCYLRSSSAPYDIVDSSAAVLITEGKSSLRFFNAPTGNYYLTVKHRNSLETWSKNGGESLTRGEFAAYDFTYSIAQAYGNNLVLKGSEYCAYSGDINQDGAIDLTDVIAVYNSSNSFLTGYVTLDVNGDSVVDLQDVVIVYNNTVKFILTKDHRQF